MIDSLPMTCNNPIRPVVKSRGYLLIAMILGMPLTGTALGETPSAARVSGLRVLAEFQTSRGKDFLGDYYYASVQKIEKIQAGASKIIFADFKGPYTRNAPKSLDDLYDFNPNGGGGVFLPPKKTSTPPPLAEPFLWEEKDGPPPVAVGMQVFVKLDANRQVEYIEYNLDVNREPYILAVRQRADRRWELLAVSREGKILHLLPNRTDLVSFEIIWTRKHGLLHTAFYSEYGAAPGDERDKLRKTKGYPVSNRPGMFVQPGRDGWIDYKTFKWPEGGIESIVPPEQFIASP